MFDTVEKIGNSQIQFGHFNKRIYIMKLFEEDYAEVLKRIKVLIASNDFTKIFAKIAADFELPFLKQGYVVEARIPDFYNNQKDVVFMSKYLDSQRKVIATENSELINKVIRTSKSKFHESGTSDLSDQFQLRKLSESDAQCLAEIYRKVFLSYPFPIFDSEYLIETMNDNINYYGIFNKSNDLVSASSAEMDRKSLNVEMTDFATLPDFRGMGFANVLLQKMEVEMKTIGITTFYTIARAHSFGMNITFSKNGYTYCGTLCNNTNISGEIESMNVWYKHDS